MTTLRQRLKRWAGHPDPFAPEPALEVIYRDLFLRELGRLGEKDHFFPTGGAANYGLLYLILRIGAELRPASVLDIGAGQSTRLWSMLHRRGLVGEVLTLEHDPEWAARIGAGVDHQLMVTPLRPRPVEGRTTLTYDWDAVRTRGRRYDVIVCDGPNGIARHSRRGILAMLDHLPEDMVLVLDDAERDGERDTVTAVHDGLRRRGIAYSVGVVRAHKTQVVFATGRYVPAAFL